MAKFEFTCPLYGRAEPDTCQTCENRCHPLPVLMPMTEQRERKPGFYSVTEILKPLRQLILSRRADLLVDPMKQIFMINGTAVHSVIEDGLALIVDKDYHKVEESFSEEIIPGYTLTGRPDYYDVRARTLWDFKNSKAFTVKKIKRAAEDRMPWNAEDYFAQLNIYRAYKYPDAEKLKLYFFVQGWTRKDEGIQPIEQVSAPMATIETVKLWVRDRFKKIKAIEDGGELPKCLNGDIWMRADGTPVRCAEYCQALSICEQGQELISKSKGKGGQGK